MGAQRVEIFFPGAIAVTGTSQTHIEIKYVAVVQRTFFISVGDLFLAHVFSSVVDRPVIERVLQSV